MANSTVATLSLVSVSTLRTHLNAAYKSAKVVRDDLLADLRALSADTRTYQDAPNIGKKLAKLTGAEVKARADATHIPELYAQIGIIRAMGEKEKRPEYARYSAALVQFASLSMKARKALIEDITKAELGFYPACDAIRVARKEVDGNAKPKQSRATKATTPEKTAPVVKAGKSEAAKVAEANDWKEALRVVLDEFGLELPKHVREALANWIA